MARRPEKPVTEEQRLALRAQALAELRELQRRVEHSCARPNAPPRYLTPVAHRDRFNHCLNLLRHAGEAVPLELYQRGSVYSGAFMSTKTGRPVDGVSLAGLLAKIAEARERFDSETDEVLSEPESP
jgi:hypothetical protein